jgi:hypothetical protein
MKHRWLFASMVLSACSSTGPGRSVPDAAAPVDAAPAAVDAASVPADAPPATVDAPAVPVVDAAAIDAVAVDAAAVLAPDAVAGTRHAALIWGYGEHVATPKPGDPLMPLDLTMKARLEAAGFVVDALIDQLSTAEMVSGAAVVVISNSVNRENLFDAGKKPRFKDVTVPVIVSKDGVIEVMGMGTGSAGGFSTPVGQSQIAIVAAGDPLAAGLTGNVRIYTEMGGGPCPPCYLHHVQTDDRLIYAFPSPAAKVVATIVGNTKQAAIFAYDKGAMMAGGVTAPARRMGFFIHRDTDYSANGTKLFDAAIAYLTSP